MRRFAKLIRHFLGQTLTAEGQHFGQAAGGRRRSARCPLDLERLEDRVVPSYVVTNTGDSGNGSLRQAILSGAGEIDFSIPTSDANYNATDGVFTITLADLLPNVNHSVVIDGRTQSGYAAVGHPMIDLNGLRVPGNPGDTFADGLILEANDNRVFGLAIHGFLGDGIHLVNSSNDVIADNYLGTDAAENAAPNGDAGVRIDGGGGNTIGGVVDNVLASNVLSGNDGDGVTLAQGTANNRIEGNFVGTDHTGTRAIPNGIGVFLGGAGTGNVIGVASDGSGWFNVLSGNLHAGVLVARTPGTVIAGNAVGTAINGTDPLPNGFSGISVALSPGTTVGGLLPAQRNVISGNTANGLDLTGTGILVENNLIGVTIDGLHALPNHRDGVRLDLSAADNTIGGADPSARNVIAGNAMNGVEIDALQTDPNGVTPDSTGDNTVLGNYIGTDLNGATAIANQYDGVLIHGGSKGNTIGGTSSGAGNVLSGNGVTGVRMSGADTTGNLIAGNKIGTNAAGLAALANQLDGVLIYLGATDETIGGTGVGARNLISGNASSGVAISGLDANGQPTLLGSDRVLGNFIGTDVTGGAALPNQGNGVSINGSAEQVTIGGTTAGAGNVISGNGARGVVLSGAYTVANVIQGNKIGTAANSFAALPNRFEGVLVDTNSPAIPDLVGNTIGGTATGAGNVISGNGGSGVELLSSGTFNSRVQGNWIGVDNSGSTALPNAGGGVVVAGSGNNTIGGLDPAARNVISGNTGSGIDIFGSAQANLVQGNFIGTDPAGRLALPNGTGVTLEYGASINTIGGTVAGAGNVISGNASAGIVLTGTDTTNNAVLGNFVGTNSLRSAGVPNFDGIVVRGGASGNPIGGTAAGAANVIAGNSHDGIAIRDVGTTGNTVAGNVIGSGAASYQFGSLTNGRDGVYVSGGAANNVIGPGNVISGNSGDGVHVSNAGAQNSDTSGITIQGNSIFGIGGLGIELGDAGVVSIHTPATTGPNKLVNEPVITLATPGATTVVTGYLRGTPGTPYTLDFYTSAAAGGSGYGPGQTFLASTTVTADGSGTSNFSVSLPAFTTNGEWLTATATNPDGNTSEFSGARSLPAGPNFGAPIMLAAGTAQAASVVGDFNGDGHQDIAVLNSIYHGGFTVFAGDGQGGFTPYATVTVAGSGFPEALAVGDFNGDGLDDLVVTESSTGPKADTSVAQVFLNDGKGGFTPGAAVTLGTKFQNFPAAGLLAVGDFNGDGKRDIAVAVQANDSSFVADRLLVLLGDGKGGLTAAPGSPLDFSAKPIWQLAAGHFSDQDAGSGLAVGSTAINQGVTSTLLTILQGSATGQLQPSSFGTQPVGNGSLPALTTHPNASGHTDLVVVAEGFIRLYTYTPPGDFGQLGTFGLTSRSPISVANPSAIVAADFNGDGALDMAAALSNAGQSTNPTVDGVPLLLSTSQGYVALSGPPLAADVGATALAVGDFNEDGKPDLVVTNAYPSPFRATTRVLLNGLPDAPGNIHQRRPDNTPATAQTLPSGAANYQVPKAAFNSANDVNYYQLNVSAGQQITVQAAPANPGAPFDQQAVPALTIDDAAGNPLATGNQTVSYSALHDGSYLIQVRNQSNATGAVPQPYTLSIRLTAAPPPSISPGVFQVQLQGGSFTYNWQTQRFEGAGTILLGLKPGGGSFVPLLQVDTGTTTAWYNADRIALSGTVSAFVGGKLVPLFKGSMNLVTTTGVTSALSISTPLLQLAGLAVTLQGLAVDTVNDALDVRGQLTLPGSIAGKVDALHADIGQIVLSPSDIHFAPYQVLLAGYSVTLPDGMQVKAQAGKTTCAYDAATDRLLIQGQVYLPTLDATATLTGANAIQVQAGAVSLTGSYAIDVIHFASGWSLRSVQLTPAANGANGDTGIGSIFMPFKLETSASFSVFNGTIGSVDVGNSAATSLNEAIGATGGFLQEIDGTLNLNDLTDVTFTGNADITFGNGPAPASLSLMDFKLTGNQATLDPTLFFGTGALTVTGSNGGLATGTARIGFFGAQFAGTVTNLTFQAHTGDLTATATLSGPLKGNQAGFTVADVGSAKATATVTTSAGTVSYGGHNIPLPAQASPAPLPTTLKVVNGKPLAADYVSVQGLQATGLPFPFSLLPKPPKFDVTVTFDKQVQYVPSAHDPASQTVTIAAGTPWFLLAARWQNDVGNVPIHVTDPNGKVWDESNFDNTTVGRVTTSDGPTTTIIGLANPLAGDWTIALPNSDSEGLGAVTFNGVGPLTPPAVTVTGLDVSGTQVTVHYHIDNSDPSQTLSLFYSTSAQQPLGLLIAAAVPAANGDGTVVWDASGVPSGSYYVTALLDGGQLPISVNQSASAVTLANQPPVLSAIADPTASPGTMLSLTVTAADADHESVTYTLDASAPAKASIDKLTGEFHWFIPPDQAPGDVPITVHATDNGTGTLSASKTFTVHVQAVNAPPALEFIANRTGAEGQLLTFTAQASDADGDALTYSLDAGAPGTAAIDPHTGIFTWTPDYSAGTANYPVTIRVTDNGTPSLSASQVVTLHIDDVNRPPVLSSIGQQVVRQGSTLQLQVSATDADLPNDHLTYSVDGAPGAVIDDTGLFQWTPDQSIARGVHQVTIGVTDSGVVPLSDSIVIPVEVLSSAPADQLLLTTPTQVTAGGKFTIGVAAVNASNDTDPNFTGRVVLAIYAGSKGRSLVDTTTISMVNGVGVFSKLAPNLAGSYTLFAASNGPLLGATAILKAIAAPKLSVTLTPVDPHNTAAGQPFNVVVNALLNGKADGDYAGTLHVTSSDPHAVLPGDVTLAKGTASFRVTLNVPGKQTVAVTDASLASLFGTSTSTTVTGIPPAGLDHFVATGFPTGTVAGVSHSVTVTAVDVYGKTVSSYAASAHLTSTLPGLTPVTLTFSKGLAKANVTLSALGTQGLVATDGTGKTGAEAGINVVSPATRLVVTADPTSVGTGGQVTITVTAQTATKATDLVFADRLHLTVGDPHATVQAQPPTGGVQHFIVTFPTAGTWSVGALDLDRPTITGPAVKVPVAVGDVSRLVVSGYPLFTVAGAAHAVTVTAQDALGNPVPTFADTVTIRGASYTFKASDHGSHTSNVTLPTLGTATLTAADSTHQTLPSVAQANITVLGAPVALTADPFVSGASELVILAPTGGKIVITPADATGTTLAVQINGKLQTLPAIPPSAPLAHLVVYGQAGALTVQENTAVINGHTATVAIPAFLLGGSGANTLSVLGSSANNVLVGGSGADVLTGGAGRDLLIGGSGADALTAGAGGSVLVAGATKFDANVAALAALLAEWASGDLYLQRVQALFGSRAGANDQAALNGQTIFADAGGNTLTGGASGLDWFVYATGDKLSNYRNSAVPTIR